MKHSAKFSDALLPEIAGMLVKYKLMHILDCFAGTGKIFQLEALVPGIQIRALELEPEWAHMNPRAIVGNALYLPFADHHFQAVVTSPTFGNRLADHFRPRDHSRRHSYSIDLGRPLHPDNSGAMQWGDAYRSMHTAALAEIYRVAPFFMLDIADHIRKGQVMPVTEWWIATTKEIGYHMVEMHRVPLRGLRQGQNHDARVGYDSLILFEA